MSALESLHWQVLKKMLEERGLKFESKAQAIAALQEGKPAEVVAEVSDELPKTASTVTFDARKPYGRVFGDIEGAPGAVYAQGGHLFNGDGVKVG